MNPDIKVLPSTYMRRLLICTTDTNREHAVYFCNILQRRPSFPSGAWVGVLC
jgi:hypothetical protein